MPTPGGPNGKYLGRSGPLSSADLRELLVDVRDQLEREPEVLSALEQAILQRDPSTITEILVHFRDFFAVLDALVRVVSVNEQGRTS